MATAIAQRWRTARLERRSSTSGVGRVSCVSIWVRKKCELDKVIMDLRRSRGGVA